MATDLPSPPRLAAPSHLLDFAKAFQYFFEDPEWVKKLLIGSVLVLLSALIIPGFFLVGYMLRLVRRSAAGEPLPLPEFDDWGGLFRDGLRMAAVYLGHLLLALALPLGMAIIAILMTGGLAGRNETLGAVASLGFALAYALFIVLMIVVSLYLPAAIARLARTDSVGAAFQVGENIAFIRRNIGNYGLTILLYFITSFAGQFGVLLCCVGVLPATFWATCVSAWAIGQAVRLDGRSPALAPRLS